MVVILEERLKSQLKDIYFDRYPGNKDCRISAYFFILEVIEIIYKVVRGDTDFQEADTEIVSIVQEGMANNIEWNFLAEYYEEIMNKQSRKKQGQFYTPQYVAGYMVDRLLEHVDLTENPQVSVMDPCCGGGVFLVKVIEGLRDRIGRNLNGINKRHPDLDLTHDKLNSFIINNIYGMDSDPLAVELTKLQLRLKFGLDCRKALNIYCGDFLTFEQSLIGNIDFDVVLGNPPYIGHKKVPMDYRKRLKEMYPRILLDKGDVSYCFIKKGVDLLKKGGYLSFIISRYFVEAPGGAGIRKFLKDSGYISEIVDFYGNRILEGIQVDPLIFFFHKEKGFSDKTIGVTRVTDKNIKGSRLFSSLLQEKGTGYKSFMVKWSDQQEKGWRLIPESHKRILEKIEKQCRLKLKDIVNNFQGVITGCDAAFIVEQARAREECLEEVLLKKWIKNSNIDCFNVRTSDKHLIYSDLIEDAIKYPNAIKHILPYRDRLEKRRECMRGVRQWYQLQWGRNRKNFERPKIVYPYKSSRNKFAIDLRDYYFSADVYAFYLKEEMEKTLSLKYLTGLLNTNLYNFYFKCFGKKLGENMYEYYPNTVLRLGIKVGDIQQVEEIVSMITLTGYCFEKEMYDALNRYVYSIFNMSSEEIRVIEKSLDMK